MSDETKLVEDATLAIKRLSLILAIDINDPERVSWVAESIDTIRELLDGFLKAAYRFDVGK